MTLASKDFITRPYNPGGVFYPANEHSRAHTQFFMTTSKEWRKKVKKHTLLLHASVCFMALAFLLKNPQKIHFWKDHIDVNAPDRKG